VNEIEDIEEIIRPGTIHPEIIRPEIIRPEIIRPEIIIALVEEIIIIEDLDNFIYQKDLMYMF
jgi:hypothetical protein